MNGHKCSFSMTEKYYSYAIIIDTVHIRHKDFDLNSKDSSNLHRARC